jgi:uncharacterized protein with FMN-binding domain
MKRFWLMVLGFITSLAGVLTITPPKFSPNNPFPQPSVLPTPAPTCVTTTVSSTPVPTFSRHKKSEEDTSTMPALPQPTTTQVCSTPAVTNPNKSSINGTFTGDIVNATYGNVQVQIIVANGVITDAKALQSPTGGRSGTISSTAVPVLRQETLSAQSASIQAVSGASYTSYGWTQSLISALSKAGF